MTRSICKALARPSSALLFALFVGTASPVIAALVPNQLLEPEIAGAPGGEGDPLKPAYEALRSGDLETAAAAFQARLREDPADPAALLGMSAVAQGQGKGEAALAWMRRALMASPQNPGLLRANARLLLEHNEPDEAVRSLGNAVRIDPEALAPRRELAALLMQLGRPAEAVPHYRRLHEPKGSEPQLAAELGVALVSVGEFAEGAALLEKAVPKLPGDLTALNALGHARLRLGHPDQALAVFERLIAANKSYPPAWLARGDALMGLDRFADAAEAYQQAARLSNTPLASLKQGVALERLGRRAAAEAAYKTALKLDPGYGPAQNNLAYLLASQQNRLDEALDWAKKAVASNERQAAYHDTLGWVRQQRGELELARAAYGEALMVDASHEAARRHLRAIDKVNFASAEKAVTRNTPNAAQAHDRRSFATDVPPPPPIVAVVPETPPAPAVPSPAPAEVSKPVAVGVSAVVKAAPTATEDAKPRLARRLEAWRTAWQGKQVDEYLAMYGKAFVPPPPLDRAGWEADRHLKLGKKGDIVVDISELETTVEGDKATMRFRQRYSSSNYRDETRKTLGWALEAGAWKIVSEEAVPVR